MADWCRTVCLNHGAGGVCIECYDVKKTLPICIPRRGGLGLGQSIPKSWKDPLGPGETAKVDLEVVFGVLSDVFGPVLPIRIRTPSARAQEAQGAQEVRKKNPKKRPLE
jgi:hypothetical protein